MNYTNSEIHMQEFGSKVGLAQYKQQTATAHRINGLVR